MDETHIKELTTAKQAFNNALALAALRGLHVELEENERYFTINGGNVPSVSVFIKRKL